MSMLSNLLNISGAGSGFSGGACIDRLPHLSLTEASASLPNMILEMQCEFDAQDRKMNDTITEAVVTAVMTESALDIAPLVEGAWETLKAKIKAFFEKIKKFLDSIIAKIKIYIDRLVMDGKRLVSKYEKDPALDKDFTDMKFQGYKFVDMKTIFPKVTCLDSKSDGVDLVKAGVGFDVKSISAFQVAYGNGKNVETAKNETDKIKDVASEDRRNNIVKMLTGVDVSTGNWKSELKETLYGGTEREEFDYNTNGFNKATVIAALKNPEDLKEIKAQYERLRGSAEDMHKNLAKDVEDFKKSKSGSSDEVQKGVEVCTNYATAFLSVIQDSFDCITSVKDALLTAAKAKNDQNKSMFGKMLTYKAKKNEATIAEDLGVFDFDF